MHRMIAEDITQVNESRLISGLRRALLQGPSSKVILVKCIAGSMCFIGAAEAKAKGAASPFAKLQEFDISDV